MGEGTRDERDGTKREGREGARYFRAMHVHGVTRAHPSSEMLTGAENTAAGDIYFATRGLRSGLRKKMRVIAATVTFRPRGGIAERGSSLSFVAFMW